MNTEQVKQLITNKTIMDFETGDQDFDHGLRLVLRDNETGELGLLAVEPLVMLDDEAVLQYSYQDISAETRLPEHLYEIATRVDPDFPKGSVPFLFD